MASKRDQKIRAVSLVLAILIVVFVVASTVTYVIHNDLVPLYRFGKLKTSQKIAKYNTDSDTVNNNEQFSFPDETSKTGMSATSQPITVSTVLYGSFVSNSTTSFGMNSTLNFGDSLLLTGLPDKSNLSTIHLFTPKLTSTLTQTTSTPSTMLTPNINIFAFNSSITNISTFKSQRIMSHESSNFIPETTTPNFLVNNKENIEKIFGDKLKIDTPNRKIPDKPRDFLPITSSKPTERKTSSTVAPNQIIKDASLKTTWSRKPILSTAFTYSTTSIPASKEVLSTLHNETLIANKNRLHHQGPMFNIKFSNTVNINSLLRKAETESKNHKKTTKTSPESHQRPSTRKSDSMNMVKLPASNEAVRQNFTPVYGSDSMSKNLHREEHRRQNLHESNRHPFHNGEQKAGIFESQSINFENSFNNLQFKIEPGYPAPNATEYRSTPTYDNDVIEPVTVQVLQHSLSTTQTTTGTTATVHHQHHHHHAHNNYYDDSSAVVVTALFDIGRGDWYKYTRSYEQYFEYLIKVLRLKNRLVIYTDSEGAKFVRQRRHLINTQIYEMTLQQLPLYRYREEMKQIIDHEQNICYFLKLPSICTAIFSYWNFDHAMKDHPESKSIDYNIVVNSKAYFVYNATKASKFRYHSKYFTWIDAGYGHADQSVIPGHCNWKPALPNGFITVIKLTPDFDKVERYSINDLYRVDWSVISGGFFGGDVETINRFYRFYHKTFMDLLDERKVDDDQTILTIVMKHYPNLFYTLHSNGDWFALFKFFPC